VRAAPRVRARDGAPLAEDPRPGDPGLARAAAPVAVEIEADPPDDGAAALRRRADGDLRERRRGRERERGRGRERERGRGESRARLP